MKKVALKKDDRIFIGSPKKVSNLLGVIPETIRRWIRGKKSKKDENGYEVYTDVTEL